ncbi:MAG: hypothetical protein CM1200mP26_00970 [Acidimicrobiales bacterium]|nr:MAG: hypothetical protein CM1200mP26_00970 [Acidimicrobiales bacterium]
MGKVGQQVASSGEDGHGRNPKDPVFTRGAGQAALGYQSYGHQATAATTVSESW